MIYSDYEAKYPHMPEALPERMSIVKFGFWFLLLCCTAAVAQVGKSVVIGAMIDRPNALMVMNPPDGNQGFLAPQITTAKRLSMQPTSPQEDGLLLFDTTEKSFYFWKDNSWVKGLGVEASSFTAYDPLTYKLSVGGSNDVDLNNLKEVPSISGNAGKFLTTDGTSIVWGMPSVGGDLSGIYPAPSVARLQGNPITPGTLTPGDAGKLLVWNGTQWTPQLVAGASPVSQYVMIDPSEFTNLRRSDKKDKDNIIMFDDNSTYVTTIRKDEGPEIIAPLQIPHGATLEEVTLYYMDREIKNIVFNVFRKTPTGGNQAVISPWSSTGNSGAIQTSLHTPITGNDIVDNSNYTYRIVVSLDQSNDVNDSNDADLRVYAVKIRYRP